VAVCGSLASEIAAAPILIGLGVAELSAAPAAIPDLKAAIRELTMSQCRDIAERALVCASAAEVRGLTLAPTPAAAKMGAMP
jgi:phosphoenolpyruvate-protein kinase (PTS system EI component)